MAQQQPIYSIIDVYPSYNDNSYTNDKQLMDEANKLRKKREEYKRKNDRRRAAGLSTAGGIISSIPAPGAAVIGGVLQVPDAIYDVSDAIEDPSALNISHAALDFFPYSSYLSKGKIDDTIFQIAGGADDGYNAITGRDLRLDGTNHVVNIGTNFSKGLRKILKNSKVNPTNRKSLAISPGLNKIINNINNRPIKNK